jgi:hypothetical protein
VSVGRGLTPAHASRLLFLREILPIFLPPSRVGRGSGAHKAGPNVFVHTATAGNSTDDYTVIDNPLTNGHPKAMVLVTSNANPGGGLGTFDSHPIGVYYTAGQWTILSQDHAAIPVNAAFNVLVYNPLYLPLVFR